LRLVVYPANIIMQVWRPLWDRVTRGERAGWSSWLTIAVSAAYTLHLVMSLFPRLRPCSVRRQDLRGHSLILWGDTMLGLTDVAGFVATRVVGDSSLPGAVEDVIAVGVLAWVVRLHGWFYVQKWCLYCLFLSLWWLYDRA
jgi:hypothetical protein